MRVAAPRPEEENPVSPERLVQIRWHHWRQVVIRVFALLRFASLQRQVSACLRMLPEEFLNDTAATAPQGTPLTASKSRKVLGHSPESCPHPLVHEGMRTRILGAGGGMTWETCLCCGCRWTTTPTNPSAAARATPVPMKAKISKETVPPATPASSSTSTSKIPATTGQAAEEKKLMDGSIDELRGQINEVASVVMQLVNHLNGTAQVTLTHMQDDTDEDDAVIVEPLAPGKRVARPSQ